VTTTISRSSLVLVPAVLALGLAACGGETSNVSQPVKSLNAQLAPTGAKLSCPTKVDGGEGATFDCTVTGPGGNGKVTMKIIKQNGSLAVDAADQAKFKAALQKAAGQ
jgi:hypothetical protein